MEQQVIQIHLQPPRHILLAHSMTGCDTASSLYGIEKRNVHIVLERGDWTPSRHDEIAQAGGKNISQAVQSQADIRYARQAPSYHVHADNQQINHHVLTAEPPIHSIDSEISFISCVLHYSGVVVESGRPEPH